MHEIVNFTHTHTRTHAVFGRNPILIGTLSNPVTLHINNVASMRTGCHRRNRTACTVVTHARICENRRISCNISKIIMFLRARARLADESDRTEQHLSRIFLTERGQAVAIAAPSPPARTEYMFPGGDFIFGA